MSELTVFHEDAANAGPAGYVPRSGELVSAKFTADDAWYRAKIKRSHPGKKEAEVAYIDCTFLDHSEPAWLSLTFLVTSLQTATRKSCLSRVSARSLSSSRPSKAKRRKRRSALSRCSIGGQSTARTRARASPSYA